MPVFVPNVETDPQGHIARFRLIDEHGRHLGANRVQLRDHPASMWEGLLDTRAHVQRYAGVLRFEGQTQPANDKQLQERLGVFLGEKVLGSDIWNRLAQGRQNRTLLVRLPDPEADLLVVHCSSNVVSEPAA